MNYFAVLRIFGSLLSFTGAMMVFPIIVALIYGDGSEIAFLLSGVISMSVGLVLWWANRTQKELQTKDGFLIVTMGWILLSAVSALPFVIHGSIPSFTDAFFEMMSGYTTTGSTILTNIEGLPHGLLFWRSMTHFIGGMGIIFMMILIIPLLGIGNLQLYKAEASPGQGPDNSKLSPRFKESAKWLWIIYVTLTLLQTILLWLGGMPLFDALCHAFATVATAGFSVKNESMGHYQSAYFDWVVIVFMFLGGMNFILHYRFIKGEWSLFFRNTELRWYVIITTGLCVLISFDLWKSHVYSSMGEALRYGSFHVISIITTTGFVTANYELWPQSAEGIIFLCLFIGACAGSTTSGIKIIQIVIIFKYLNTKMQRILEPLSITSIRINGYPVEYKSIGGVLSLFVVNILIVVFGSMVMVHISNMDFFSSFMSVVSAIWNIGPAFGQVGPTENFAHITDVGKWFLSFSMLVGRLDIFTVLVMFYPSFWKK